MSAAMNPPIQKVTLVLCTRNGGERLRKCLDHIEALDADSSMEVLLIDNGSDDGVSFPMAEEFARSSRFNVKVRVTTIPGNSAGRNVAVKESTGDLLIFIDDDCYADPQLVREWVKAFERKKIGFGSGMVRRYDLNFSDLGCVEHPNETQLDPDRFIWRGFVQGSNMAFLRKCLDDAGPFDERFGAGTPYAGEEWDVALRASRAGWSGAYIPAAQVWHDHRRTEAEAASRIRFYDFGGGVIYAKHTFTRSGIMTLKEVRREVLRIWRSEDRGRFWTFAKGYATYFLVLAGRSSSRRGPAR